MKKEELTERIVELNDENIELKKQAVKDSWYNIACDILLIFLILITGILMFILITGILMFILITGILMFILITGSLMFILKGDVVFVGLSGVAIGLLIGMSVFDIVIYNQRKVRLA